MRETFYHSKLKKVTTEFNEYELKAILINHIKTLRKYKDGEFSLEIEHGCEPDYTEKFIVTWELVEDTEQGLLEQEE